MRDQKFDAELELLEILEQLKTDASVSTVKPDTVPKNAPTPTVTEPVDATVLPVTPIPDQKPEEAELILDFDKENIAPIKEDATIFEAESPAELPTTVPMVVSAVNPWSRILDALKKMLPSRKDSVQENIRKCVFFVSLIVLIVSLVFLLYYMVIEPGQVENKNQQYAELFHEPETENNSSDFPPGMNPRFRQLFTINPEVAGWLTYRSESGDPFLNIDLPVVLGEDNDKYLKTGFDGAYSRSGTLFFDASNGISPGTSNKVSIIYGHNMASGAMFAHLNKMIGNVYRARSAPIIELTTLYDSARYKVFAVLLSDEDAEDARYFSYLRTKFADDQDFLAYTDELKARSLFDYPVDIQEKDELLILSTCTNPSQAKLKNGRLAVVARRIRPDEEQQINTLKIVENTDAIMPFAWYTAQKLTPHSFYEVKEQPVTTTATSVDTATTTTSGTGTTIVGGNTTASGGTSAGTSATTGDDSTTTTGSTVAGETTAGTAAQTTAGTTTDNTTADTTVGTTTTTTSGETQE
jgi:sortase B